ncbi:hypothetical protein N431DRAFT_468366 [Stipitochalara longipes BDJ]|nr:hypothetical protein N431DRAFT_468366 [Stipitochalara longipes BDJ]
MAPVLLVQAPDYSTLTSVTASRISWQHNVITWPEYQNYSSVAGFIKTAIKDRLFCTTRLISWPRQVLHFLSPNLEALQSGMNTWAVQVWDILCSAFWGLLSCLSLFWGFALGVLIVLVLVRTMKWAGKCEIESSVEEKTGYEYHNLSSQLDFEDEIREGKCETDPTSLNV